jgi:3-oxochol-4-en-24-oyl-CoA dehydrogenase
VSIGGGTPGLKRPAFMLELTTRDGDRITDMTSDISEFFAGDISLNTGPGNMVGLIVLAARGMSIAGGMSEITRNQIAERILGLPRDPLAR